MVDKQPIKILELQKHSPKIVTNFHIPTSDNTERTQLLLILSSTCHFPLYLSYMILATACIVWGAPRNTFDQHFH